jgi:DNA repair protein RadC
MQDIKYLNIKTLLAQSLREKAGSYIIEALFSRFPTPADLVDATEQELTSIKGIGKIKALQIISTLKLANTLTATSIPVHKIKSPEDVYKLIEPEFRHLKKEHFICIYLDTKNGVIGKETVSIGSLNASIVHPRELFRGAIKRSCASIICSHNHPSGNPEPSPEDIDITKRINEAGTIIGIDVLDHIIIGNFTFVSMKERGLF